MENLNAEQIKEDLDNCLIGECELCTYYEQTACKEYLMHAALALITSQEQRIKELAEENERLRGILLQFTDIVHKWGNKNGYDTSEISLVPILNEETAIKAKIKANTVRKMQEELNNYFNQDIDYYGIEVRSAIDQIAKEMLNEKIQQISP